MMAHRSGLLDLKEVVRLVRDEVEQAGSQAEWARKTGVNKPDLSSTVTGKRPPTRDILRALNLTKAFAYQRVSGRHRGLLRIEDVVDLLRDEVIRGGGQAGWARNMGVNRPNMNSTLTGRCPPMNDVLRVLGLKKVFAYEREGRPRERARQ